MKVPSLPTPGAWSGYLLTILSEELLGADSSLPDAFSLSAHFSIIGTGVLWVHGTWILSHEDPSSDLW
jgi:hypothetical protein